MKLYLNILNLLVLAYTVFAGICLSSWLGGFTVLIGTMAGACLSTGMITKQYCDDGSRHREERWMRGFFRKSYLLECSIQSFFMFLSLAFLWFGVWSWFFRVLFGFTSVFLLNYAFEWFWAKVILPHQTPTDEMTDE